MGKNSGTKTEHGNMFLWLVLTLFLKTTTEGAEVRHTLEDVYYLVSRIDDSLRKEDRLREVTQIIRIDATLKNIEKRLSELADRMGDDDLGRGISSDMRSDLRTIGDRIEKMEDTSQSLKTMISKMDRDLKMLEQIEQRTNQLEKELELRLTKLMNAISSLHEMNKDLSNHIRTRGRTEEKTELSSSSSDVTYLTEVLEDVEKRVKEQLSILEARLRKELDSLKVLTSNALVHCESTEEEEEYLQPGSQKRQGKIYDEQIDTLAKNLSKTQQEIRDEFHTGMQGLEQKLIELSSISVNCGGESRNDIITSEAPKEAKPKCVSDQFVRDAKNCADLRRSGTTCDGVYFVFHPSGRAIKLYCDMTTDGGGWSVIMRRGDFGTEPVNFNLPWRVYKHGFGDMNQEFWLGNENIHLLTNGGETNQLRIDLESFSSGSRNFTYNSFSIDNENNEYRMHVKEVLGGRSPHFLYYDNRPFVTYDRITDQPGDCAQKYKGGWWYRKHCMYSVLTAERFVNETRTSMAGMQSQLWRAAGVLKGAEMKIRPQNFYT